MNYDMIQRHLVIKCLARSETAIFTDHARLDCTAALQLDHAGDDPGMREIDPLNPLMRFGQNLLSKQVDNGKLRLDLIEHVRLQQVQQQISLRSIALQAGARVSLSVINAYSQVPCR